MNAAKSEGHSLCRWGSKGPEVNIDREGVDVSGMKRQDMVSAISLHDDFLNEKSSVESY